MSSSGFGCYIDNVFMGAAAYADDVVIMSPTVHSVNKLLNLCHKFSLAYDVKFNPTKSKYLYFPSKRTKNVSISKSISLGGELVPTVSHEKHVGLVLGVDAFKKDVDKRVCELNACTNTICNVYKLNNLVLLYKLLKIYGMSVYGSQLWDFSKATICNKFFTCWRKCIRKLLNLPARTHNNLIPAIISDDNVDVQLHRRLLKFVYNVLTNNNPIIKMCGQLAINGSSTALSRSVKYLCSIYNINMSDLIYKSVVTNIAPIQGPTTAVLAVAGAIQELTSTAYINCLTKDDRTQLITHLCTS